MKLFRLSMMLTVFMLTGILDFLISAVPLVAAVWALASGSLGVMGLVQGLEKNKVPGLAKIHVLK